MPPCPPFSPLRSSRPARPLRPPETGRASGGPNADNISTEKGIPLEWSDSKNLAWKMDLPGPGSSSPIVHGDRVFVTCYSGYGLSRNAGRVDDLKRHLVCLDAKTGEIIFDKTVESAAREDNYSGFITEHGYASSTPVTDGVNVY